MYKNKILLWPEASTQEAWMLLVTNRISDRGLTLETPDSKLADSIKLSRLWEMQLFLPDGFVLVCHGRILPIKGSRFRFLFKYEGLSESSRKILFSLIRENNPVREKLV